MTELDSSHIDGMLLNMKLCPSLLDKPGGIMNFKQLVETYFDKDGQEIQFDLLCKDMLLYDRDNPRTNRCLVVLVAPDEAHFERT